MLASWDQFLVLRLHNGKNNNCSIPLTHARLSDSRLRIGRDLFL